jgi:predicted negative regulator of RcsB-dependent stress response
MDRLTRKNLKTDKFAEEVSHTFDFLSEHRTEAVRYGSIGLAVIVLAVGYYFYTRHQAGVREEALAQAMRIDDATIGSAVLPTNLHYNTQEEKDNAHKKAYGDLASKYRGTLEGAMAAVILAADAADAGKLDEAEKRYRDIADSAPATYAALAKLSLSQVYASEGKTAEAEKILRDLMAHPALTVSKEAAALALGRVLVKTNPAEARKVLEPLRNERAAISQAAVTALGEIPPQVLNK